MYFFSPTTCICAGSFSVMQTDKSPDLLIDAKLMAAHGNVLAPIDPNVDFHMGRFWAEQSKALGVNGAWNPRASRARSSIVAASKNPIRLIAPSVPSAPPKRPPLREMRLHPSPFDADLAEMFAAQLIGESLGQLPEGKAAVDDGTDAGRFKRCDIILLVAPTTDDQSLQADLLAH